MPTYYLVKQGEHLSRLAHQYGICDYSTIWNHPENAELRRKRKNPNILYPGDSLFIPDRELGEEVWTTDKCHVFVMRRPSLKLRLVVEDLYEKPVANAACTLSIQSDFLQITTDRTGKIEQDIPPDAEKAMLIIRDSKTATRRNRHAAASLDNYAADSVPSAFCAGSSEEAAGNAVGPAVGKVKMLIFESPKDEVGRGIQSVRIRTPAVTGRLEATVPARGSEREGVRKCAVSV
jgi:hypothetical protein